MQAPKLTSRRQFLRAAFVGAASTVVLAACGQAAAPTATTAPPPAEATKPPAATAATPVATAKPAAGAPVELRMTVRQAAEGTKTEAGIAAFQTQNPGITVKLEAFPGDKYLEKILALGAGGDLQDVVYANVGFYAQMANAGFWAEVDPIVQSEKYDLSPFYKSALDYLRWKGKLYALPYKGHSGYSAIWYNKEMASATGVDPSKIDSYDSLVAMATKLTKSTKGDGNTDVWGWLNPGLDGWGLIGHFHAFGGEEVSPVFEAKTALLDQPQQMAAITWLHSTFYKWKICPLPGGTDYTQLFVSGAAAFMNGGLWMSGNQAAIGTRFNQDVVPMPKGPGGSIPGWFNFDQMAMSAKTKHQPEAWKLFTYFCGKEMGIRLGGSEGGGSATPGARRDVYESPELAKAVPSIPVFAKMMGDVPPMWYAANLQTAKVWTTVGQALQTILLDSNPPTAEACKQANALVQGVLDEPMA